MKSSLGRTMIVIGVALLLVAAASRLAGGRGRGFERQRVVMVERGAAPAARQQVRPERAERLAAPFAGKRGWHGDGGFGRGRDRGHGFFGLFWLGGLLPLALLGLLLAWPRLRSEAHERGWRRGGSRRRMMASPAGHAAHCAHCGRGYERRPDPWDNQLL